MKRSLFLQLKKEEEILQIKIPCVILNVPPIVAYHTFFSLIKYQIKVWNRKNIPNNYTLQLVKHKLKYKSGTYDFYLKFTDIFFEIYVLKAPIVNKLYPFSKKKVNRLYIYI